MRIAGMVGLLTLWMSTLPAIAEVTSDTLTGTVVNQNGTVFNITGGTTAGGRNLFHSFDRFDVPTGGAANFLNDPSIVNIFSRVTGGKISEIDGVLRSQGSANFFLMNPSGIVFGQNASLDIGGSFVATTANGIQFSDRGAFTASASPVSDVLAIDPSAFLFNSISPPAGIEVRSQGFAGVDPTITSFVLGLRVPDQRSIVLVGGDIRLQNGNLYAFDGGIELGGLVASGTVALRNTGERFQLQFGCDWNLMWCKMLGDSKS
jgi:filamentous hemagglutinin family protein